MGGAHYQSRILSIAPDGCYSRDMSSTDGGCRSTGGSALHNSHGSTEYYYAVLSASSMSLIWSARGPDEKPRRNPICMKSIFNSFGWRAGKGFKG